MHESSWMQLPAITYVMTRDRLHTRQTRPRFKRFTPPFSSRPGDRGRWYVASSPRRLVRSGIGAVANHVSRPAGGERGLSMSTYPRQALCAAVAVVAATALGLVGVHAHRAAGATQPEAGSAAGPGTFVCTDRRGRLTLVRGDGRARRTIGLKGENPSFSPDGRQIAFRPLQRGVARTIAPKLLVSDRSGGNVHTVVSLPRSDSYGTPPRFEPLSWSSDSRRVAYVRESVLERGPDEEPAAANRLFTADPDGGERAVPLHRAASPHPKPSWRSGFSTRSPPSRRTERPSQSPVTPPPMPHRARSPAASGSSMRTAVSRRSRSSCRPRGTGPASSG